MKKSKKNYLKKLSCLLMKVIVKTNINSKPDPTGEFDLKFCVMFLSLKKNFGSKKR
jgi:hypothetical protein